MNYYLSKEELPTWFNYPKEFIRLVDQSITNLTPWYFIEGEAILHKYNGLKERYPSRNLVPFAEGKTTMMLHVGLEIKRVL